jgi:hypothetical protein
MYLCRNALEQQIHLLAVKFVVVFLIVSVLFIVSVNESHAQKYDASLILDAISSQIQSGNTITFSGQLTTSDGQYVIPHRTIYIKDDVDFGTDTIIGSIETDDMGKFSGSWIAVPRNSGSYDFYAVFEGDDYVQKARSKTFSVYVYEGGSSSPSSGSSGYSNPPAKQYPNYYKTTITLDRIQSSIFAGESITFTGTLTSGNNPVSNAIIKIMEDDPLSPDQLLSAGRTNSNGEFAISWQASKGYVETDFDIYATFDGDSNYLKARSPNQIMSVLRHSGSISLDPIPKSANIGDIITFSGTLELNQGRPEGAIVYIKDEDPLSGDDLLATAYVDGNGRFSANWFVTDVDADGVADIYAVFEGNDVFYRLTTCDPNPTMDYGSSCLNTIPLDIHHTAPASIQPNPNISGNGYMELFYSLDFTQNPHVTIVPNPDAYNDAKKYIIPTEEGILMWKSYLDNKYGGNWNVDFEVVTPGNPFFESKPDVVINLVTPEQEFGCNYDFYGITRGILPNPSKPIQASVCVIFNGQKRDMTDVSATAAHEFIHAVGLGHAFNKDGDLMCSVENGMETCRTANKAKIPSDLNLSGVTTLYGIDGFKNPNSKVTYGTKVALESSYKKTIEKSTKNTIASQIDSDKDNIPDYRDKCKTKPETYNGYRDTDGCPDKKPK